MQDFAEWTRSDPALVFDLHTADAASELSATYGGARDALFAQILSQADRAGARSALVEYRYIDADYRSEHSRFYSTTFRRYPSITHRIHFFSSLLSPDHTDVSRPTAFGECGYLGYCVVRPVDASPVGRTMIKPVAELASHVSCVARDVVNVFGSTLHVDASPFMAQDFQLGVCVHVTAWVCAYYHHLRFGGARLLPADIAGYTPMERGRLVPSGAVTVTQLVQLLERAGLPPVTYSITRLPTGESIESIACRYLDSGMPVVVAGGGHVFALMGYRWVREDGRRRLQFIRQDDLEGPYVIVESVPLDKYRPWEYLIIPLPAKVYMSGERAESLGRTKLLEALVDSEEPAADDLLARIHSGELEFRTSVHRSNEFKQRIEDRGCDALLAAYQWLRMSRWVWVVELVIADRWYSNQPSVLAEVVIDATGHAEDQQALAWRVPGTVSWTVPDYSTPDAAVVDLDGAQVSVVDTDTSVTDL